MLTKNTNNTALIEELTRRLADCDELLLLRAFKKMANTEIASILAGLPVHHANHVLIILPNDLTRRVTSSGFDAKPLTSGTLRKIVSLIDGEIAAKTKKEEKAVKAFEPPVIEEPREEESSSTSILLLDTISKIVGNTFRKH